MRARMSDSARALGEGEGEEDERTYDLALRSDRISSSRSPRSWAGRLRCVQLQCPGFHAPAPGVTPLPPGVTPTPTPLPTPTSTPIASTSCSQGAAAVALGPALAPFAVLAGSTVTNVGNTLVTFGPGAVTGGVNDDLIGVSPEPP